jgi:catalase
MDDPGIAEELTLQRPDGSLALRPVHAIGIAASGFFVPAPIARAYCIAPHFQAPASRVPVTVRFSNGSGCAVAHDGWSDVRGMATRFDLGADGATDLIAMTLPEFFSPTPASFLDFAKAAKPQPVKRESPWRKLWDMLRLTPPLRNPYPGETISPDGGAIAFADQNTHAQNAVLSAAAIGAPVSYARAAYHAVHTFIITDPNGTRRYVRFSWQPVSGVLVTDPNATPVDNYLQAELRARLAKSPAHFSLMMAIGETGDDFNDSSRGWPPHRPRIMMGTLTLAAVSEDQTKDSEKISFNPGLLTKGIELSDDPVLQVRVEAYKISSKWRGGDACPFSGA